jgi:hypothetical protein
VSRTVNEVAGEPRALEGANIQGPEGTKGEAEAKEDLGDGLPSGLPPGQTGTDRDESDAAKRGPEDRQSPKWTDGTQAVCAVLLVLITIGYVYYSAGQTRASQEAANAAKSAADTAAAQLSEMRTESASSSSQFKAQITRADAQFRAQLGRLDKSIQAANANTSATQALAAAARVEARQAERTANASNQLAAAASSQTAIFKETLEQARLQERPYLNMVVTSMQAAPSKDRIIAQVTVANFGHSPALRVEVKTALIQGPVPVVEAAAASYFASRMSRSATDSEATIPPSSLGQTQPGVSVTLTSSPLLPSQIDENLKTDRAVYVVGRARYRDYEGRSYHAEACFYRSANGEIRYCDKYNTGN